MLADAGQEHSELLRLLDYQGFPVDELHYHIGAFFDRTRALFSGIGTNDPVAFNTGHTAHMLNLLRNPIGIPKADGSLRIIGHADGVSQDTLMRCARRMCNWIVIAHHTLSAEFPAFEVVQAFAVLNVNGKAGDDDDGFKNRERCYRQLTCLREAFAIDTSVESLEAELERYRHIASRIACDEGLDSRDAWRRAAQIILRRRTGSTDCRGLLALLVRFWASGASTSGVEQSFAAALGTAGNALEQLGDSHLDDRHELIDLPKHEEEQVIALAGNIWSKIYGFPRNSGNKRASRCDAGKPRKRSLVCESGWRAKRKAEITTQIRKQKAHGFTPDNDDDGGAAAFLDPDLWTDKHEQDIAFVKNKRVIALAEELFAGRSAAAETADTVELQGRWHTWSGKSARTRTTSRGRWLVPVCTWGPRLAPSPPRPSTCPRRLTVLCCPTLLLYVIVRQWR